MVLKAILISGDLVLVDVRESGQPHSTLRVPGSRGDPVTDIAWLNTKTGSDLLATLADGRVVKWDVRNTSLPSHLLDLNTEREPGLARFGATGLSVDPAVPHREVITI